MWAYSSCYVGSLLTLETGCMESLVYYKGLQLRSHTASITQEIQSTLNVECIHLLNTLQTIDPDRKQRYVDLGKSCQ